jgi:muramoyltetrapeptide carboxypeptidase LdcA involved in peptidoglycan recycling
MTDLSKLIIPQALKAGDKIATVSLSWGGAGEPDIRHRYELGKQRLQDVFGLEVVEMTNTLKGADYLYNNPQARVDDLHEAFSRPDIKGVFSCIGGIDSVRLIDKIDFDLLRQNPKIFTGYSDSTVTHFALLKAGVRSYYGPAVLTGYAENVAMHNYMLQSVKTNFFDTKAAGIIQPAAEGWTDELLWWKPENANTQRTMQPQTGWQYIQGEGAVQGRLIGGCTELMQVLPGSKIWPSLDIFKDSFLFLENCEDQMSVSNFEHFLRGLGAQGVLQTIKGLLFAKPCRVPFEKWPEYDAILLKIAKEFDRTDLTIVTNMDFGHTDPQFVLPFGALGEIDSNKKQFSILEPACV